MRGDREALVTLVVFSDFQCPFCGRLEPTLSDLRAHHTESELRIVWKNNPLAFHPQARPAAEAAEGVFEIGGNTAFWAFHDAAFADQKSLSASSYDAWAKATGVDMTKWRAGLAAGDFSAKVSEDLVLGSTVHVSGTPTCFINGITVSGAQPLSAFTAIVDTELIEARRISGTVAADRIYVTRSKANVAMPVPVPPSSGPPIGVTQTDLVVGAGAMAIRGDTLSVQYKGTLDNGTVFDDSHKRGPFTFELGAGHVIKGWDTGVAGMRAGGKRRLVIEPDFAYGVSGRPPAIPPNARLTFEIELLSIK